MNCDETRALVTAYVDAELDVAHSREVEWHIQTCPACARLVENQQRLRSSIQASGLRFDPPSSFDRRLDAALRTAAKNPERARTARWPWVAIAAGIILALVLASKLGNPGKPVADSLLAQELVDSHVRSLLPGRLMDVESTDRHTVKPWFNGKLDFSPPVEDFTAEGFPLVGGRLDSLAGRTVAVLVYKRAQHVINLYVWPSAAPPSSPRSAVVQGYNILNWTRANFAWSLVSDLNRDELQQFASRLQKTAP